jgi:hypothetical protein
VKFRFKNIGPVKDAELQLGALTVIAGRNNTGKTYLAYTLYGFLKQWTDSSVYYRHSRNRRRLKSLTIREELNSDVAELVSRTITEGQGLLDLDLSKIKKIRKNLMKSVPREFSRAILPQVFSSRHSSFSDSAISVEIAGAFPESISPIEGKGENGEEFLLEFDGERLSLCINSLGDLTETPRNIKTRLLANSVLETLYSRLLFPELAIDPFVLSAERFGISLFYRELDFTKNQLVDILQGMGDDKDRERISPYLFIDRATSRYAMPIKDNIDYTRSIPDLVKGKSEVYEDKFFDNIKHMMGGYYRVAGDDRMFISKARGRNRFEIPLHISSSSTRGLSDLYFFLRHVARKDHLLIIDEPESHLDTFNQILLARLLARMVNAGLKILVTTHSDYLVKEINNLIMLSSEFDQKDHVINKLKYSSDDFLAGDSVRAYVAESESLTKCEVDRFGIEMPVFDETIDNINRVSNELAARLYTPEDVEE